MDEIDLELSFSILTHSLASDALFLETDKYHVSWHAE